MEAIKAVRRAGGRDATGVSKAVKKQRRLVARFEKRRRAKQIDNWCHGDVPAFKPKVRLDRLADVRTRKLKPFDDPGSLAYCKYRSPHTHDVVYLLVRVLEVNKITANVRFYSDWRYKLPIHKKDFMRKVDIGSLFVLEMV
ncbi:hypothetical protein [Poriferisphaera sp. WC338]|uniref:hypothetical protein n=1 Tax=Poriferisphaera sp. WC338 TaxID=3425129 RepID=UPI003D8130FA